MSFRTSVCTALLALVSAAAACTDDEPLYLGDGGLPAVHAGAGGGAGISSAGSSSGGTSDGGGSGGSSGSNGGGTSGDGGAAGTGGASGNAGSSGGGTSGAAGAAPGDAAADAVGRVQICARLEAANQNLTTLTSEFVRGYIGKVLGDCRVSAMFGMPIMTHDFANDFGRFNWQFWGCVEPAVASFGLFDERRPGVTPAEAALLIDFYIAQAYDTLDLSSGEETEMRAELAELAVTAAISSPDDFPISNCPDAGQAGASASE